ncbi:hypothetical protein [Actinomadura sp. 6K520]|uniref:hypothetical protein n=1 Tax=Actinomadura sp. 6K520 TaxID=2530364 RepID=UPI00104D7C32|nr:hypothetical protein [Actinomadura sp. 6K520]TDE33396.1 hypothetical protein E1289_12700 [Actinomadura sp. 6K520]
MAPKEAAPIPAGVQPVGSLFSLGVDIHGLAALATKLYGYVPPGERIVEEVESSVKKLVGDAGWRGDDANAFQDAWGADAGDAKKLSMFTDDAAKIMDDLASALAELQISANNRKLDYERKSDRATDDPERQRDLSIILRDAKEKAREMQRSAADRLVALYSGKAEGSWSVLDAAKARSKDENVSKGLRDKLGDVEDELDDGLADDDFPWTDFVGWVGGGAGIGAAVGAFFGGVGAIPGSAVGGGIGLAAGAVVGGGKWAVDQIDDWF